MTLKSPTEVRAMFESVAKRYDLLNRLCSLGLDRRWRSRLVGSLAPRAGSRILDLASGTGDVALLLRRSFSSCHVVGLDCAAKMLAKASEKMAQAGLAANGSPLGIALVQAWGEALPFSDASFSAVTCAFGVRNFRPMELVLREVYRVLEPGGALSVLEFSMPQAGPWKWLYTLYLGSVVPGLGRVLSSAQAYSYLDRSIREFLSPEDLCRVLEGVGFVSAGHFLLAGGAVALVSARKGTW